MANVIGVVYVLFVIEHKAVVQYLLKRGYNPNQVDAEGNTCLDLAQKKNAPWMVDLLSGETSASDVSLLHVTIQQCLYRYSIIH